MRESPEDSSDESPATRGNLLLLSAADERIPPPIDESSPLPSPPSTSGRPAIRKSKRVRKLTEHVVQEVSELKRPREGDTCCDCNELAYILRSNPDGKYPSDPPRRRVEHELIVPARPGSPSRAVAVLERRHALGEG